MPRSRRKHFWTCLADRARGQSAEEEDVAGSLSGLCVLREALPGPGPQFPHLHGDWGGVGTGSLAFLPVLWSGEGAQGRALASKGTAWGLQSGPGHLQVQPPACRHYCRPVPALGAAAVCTREREGRGCSCPPRRSPSGLWVALLLPTARRSLSAMCSFSQSIIHSVRPAEHPPREGASRHLPGQGLWAESTDVLGARAGPPSSPMVGNRWSPRCGPSPGRH